MTLASAIPEILLGAQKFIMGHVTLTTLILRIICHPFAGLDIAYMHTEFDHFIIFSRSRDMVGTHQKCLTWACPFQRWFAIYGLALVLVLHRSWYKREIGRQLPIVTYPTSIWRPRWDDWDGISPSSLASEDPVGWLRGSVVGHRSLAGVLSLSCARPVDDGWPDHLCG